MASIIFGSEYEFLSTGIAADMAIGIPSESGFVIVYRDVPDSHDGTARVGQVSGTVIAYGTPYDFFTDFAGAQNTSIATLEPTKYVATYGNLATNNRGEAMVADVSGTTISFGDGYYYQIGSNGITEGAAATLELDGSGFLVAWEDPTILGGSPNSYIKVGNVSGNTIAFGDAFPFVETDGGRNIDAVDLVSYSSSGFVVLFNRTIPQGRARVGSISGTTISYGQQYDFSTGGAEYIAAVMLDSTRFAIVYKDAEDSDHGTAKIGTVSGNTLTFGPEAEFASDGMDDQMAISRVNDNEFIVTYVDTNDGDIIKTKVGTAFGTHIVFGDASQVGNSFGITGSTYLSTKVLDENRFVVVWRDEQDSGHGTSMIGQVPETAYCDLFIRGPELVIGSNDLYISGAPLSVSTSRDLFIQGPLLDSEEIDLFINSYETDNGDLSLYIRSFTSEQASADLFIHGPELVANSGSLFMYGFSPEDLVYRVLYLHIETPPFGTPQASGDLFIYGHTNYTNSDDLFINGYDILQTSGDLYISGSAAIITDSFDLFISAPIPVSDNIDLFIRGITVIPPSSGDEGRAMDWLLRTSDHYPQIIGAFDPAVSGVSIRIWDIVDGQNTLVPLTSSGCYSINDTGRWGWSTSNLPGLTGHQHQYYYMMTGDPSGTFDGQFFLEVPEDAKWIYPPDQDEYIL
jgi:hypothetical protein